MELHFITGTDDYRKGAYIHNLRNKHKEHNIKVFRPDSNFLEYIEEEDLFYPVNKFVVVLEAEKVSVTEYTKSILESDRPHVLIFCTSSDQRNKKVESIKNIKITEYNELKTYENNNELKPWISKLVRANSIQISPEAYDLFCEYMNIPDLHAVQAELDKLKYYKKNDVITSEDVILLVESRLKLNMWDSVIALLDSKLDIAVEKLRKTLEEESAHAVLAGMYNFMFKMFVLSDMTAKKESMDNISKAIGIPKFVITSNFAHISAKNSLSKITKALHYMCLADSALIAGFIPHEDVMVQLYRSIHTIT